MLDFHLGNLEYSCAASMSKVSCLHWDQNESLPQFTGSHVWLPGGYGLIIESLAKGLDIKHEVEVSGTLKLVCQFLSYLPIFALYLNKIVNTIGAID